MKFLCHIKKSDFTRHYFLVKKQENHLELENCYKYSILNLNLDSLGRTICYYQLKNLEQQAFQNFINGQIFGMEELSHLTIKKWRADKTFLQIVIDTHARTGIQRLLTVKQNIQTARHRHGSLN